MSPEGLERPLHVRGERRRHVDQLVGQGMPEPQPVGMERLAVDEDRLGVLRGQQAEPIGADHVRQRQAVAAGVELVGHDRMADVREVDADLVGAAGLRLAPDQREAAEPLDDLVERHRGLAAVLRRADRHLLADGRVEADRPLDVVAVALRDAVDQRQVFLVDLALLELQRQPAVGQVVLDDDQQAGGVAVEAVDDARADSRRRASRACRSGTGAR